jgi:hypothetical protein
VSVEVEPVCWRRYSGPGGVSEIVRPDLYAITASEAFEDCWFLEIDRGTESPAAIRRKCLAYETYWRTGIEQQRNGTFPLVAWVAPDERRAGRIERENRDATTLRRELFRVTTSDRLVELIAEGAG